MTTPETNLVDAAAALGRRDVKLEAHPSVPFESVFVARVRDDERIDVHDIESSLMAPRAPRGDVTLHDPDDFVAYVERLANPAATTVWADVNRGRVTAVFDDHQNAGAAGWRRHTAVLALQPDPDWDAWMASDGKPTGQAEFAEQLEQLLHTVVDPKAADLYEVTTSLQATRRVSFRSGVRLNSGDTELTYDEQTDAKAGKGKLEIPQQFTVRIAPFAYTDPVDLVAKLRYRIDNGRLALSYVLIQPHIARQNAFASIVGKIRGDLALEDSPFKLPVFLGAAPERVR